MVDEDRQADERRTDIYKTSANCSHPGQFQVASQKTPADKTGSISAITIKLVFIAYTFRKRETMSSSSSLSCEMSEHSVIHQVKIRYDNMAS